MAQAVHASFAFYHDHPKLTADWLRVSNYLVIVSVPDENQLLALIEAAGRHGIKRTAVREPDVHDEVTAVAFEPTDAARRLTANLPLALKCKQPCVCEHCDPLAFAYERKAAANA